MFRAHRVVAAAALLSCPMLSVACGSTSTSHPTSGTGATASGPVGEITGSWTAPVAQCSGPAAATAPIGTTVRIGSVMPLTGGPAAGFAPVAAGFKLYIDYANAHHAVAGHTLSLDIEDDQYNQALTPGAVERLVQGAKVDLVAGVLGTADNLAVRDTLNEECIPQLNALSGSPEWGRPVDYPWTTGLLVNYATETKIYGNDIHQMFPSGAKVATFAVDNEFGKAYTDTLHSIATQDGLTLVDAQTIAATDATAPTAQVDDLAAKRPDVIVAVPLGLQCPTFLKTLADVEAATPGWKPTVFLTNSCASRLFVGKLAGAAGVGVITSNAFKDVSDAANASDAGVATFLGAYQAAGLDPTKLDPATTATGWTAAEVTVAIIRAAAATGTLSRASIMTAARTLTYTPLLARTGVRYQMNGALDGYGIESLQLLRWDGTTYEELGPTVTKFEGATTYR
jgi:ABC-type branched-subunit amino acid transport system substrate-binding protein